MHARFSRATPLSASAREAPVDSFVAQLARVVLPVALLGLEEVCDVVADVELERPADRVEHREPGVGMDLLEVDGAAFLATAVDAGQTTAADRGPRGEPRPHRDVETETHDGHRQLLPGEVLVARLSPPGG